MKEKTIILNHEQIMHKLRRMAYQIYEANAFRDHVVIAGISEQGYKLASLLRDEVSQIAPFKMTLCRVTMDKTNPIDTVTCDLSLDHIKDQSIILVDDVLHSGTALIYGVGYFLQVPLAQFKTAVLVDRNHKKYPIKADFKGISLSTSLNENVVTDFSQGNYSASLV
ncbi:phosphoribosyltransferase family protein [Flavobacteriaceae bacterium]|nr:phosphoribosyltransferase family protein [Flavobacteriaceae bacterium]